MRYLTSVELYQIKGGFEINSTFINAIVKAASFILELGKSMGSSIRRAHLGKLC